MLVYNTKIQYIKEAVTSILNLSIKDFEFMIVDDGCTNSDITQYLEELKLNDKIMIVKNN